MRNSNECDQCGLDPELTKEIYMSANLIAARYSEARRFIEKISQMKGGNLVDVEALNFMASELLEKWKRR